MAYIYDSHNKNPWLQNRLEDLFNHVFVGRVMGVVVPKFKEANRDDVELYIELAALYQYSVYSK